MSRPCDACPCPDTCLRWPAFCEWAAEDPADPVKIAHIRARSGMPARQPEYPPLAQQAGNALAAAGRVVAAAATGGPIWVPPEVYRERLIICMECEFNGARPAGVHCMKCGCGGMKLGLVTEKCPIEKW